jgi:hypothetical protein
MPSVKAARFAAVANKIKGAEVVYRGTIALSILSILLSCLALWRASSIHYIPHSFLFFDSPALRTSAHPVIAGSAPLGIKLPKAGIVAKVSKRPNEALQQPFVFDADLLAFNDVHGSDNDVCGCSGDVLSSSYTHSWQQPQGESLNPAP